MKKIIWIASFNGNIGDVLNHEGFYSAFPEVFTDSEIEKIEIRRFYQSAENRLFFDIDFAHNLNKYDLVIIGGGGFFDLQWLYSSTGTTIDISEDFINCIFVPVWVNAMGYHEYPDKESDDLYRRFKKFLIAVINKPNWFVSVRNDGSFFRLKRYNIQHGYIEVPDNGLYYEPSKRYSLKNIHDNRTMIGMCITNDLFNVKYNKDISCSRFNNMIIDAINDFCELGFRVCLLTHTPADVTLAGELISKLPSNVQRENIMVSPFAAKSRQDVEQLSEYYRMCDCVIGMRFHSLVFSIINNVPCVALSGHEQIEAFFCNIGLKDYCVIVNNDNIAAQIEEKVQSCIFTHKEKREYKIIKNNLLKQKNEYRNRVLSFLNK